MRNKGLNQSGPGSATAKVEALILALRRLRAERRKAEGDAAKPGPLGGGGAGGGGKPAKSLSMEAKIQASLTRLRALLDTRRAELDASYEQGLVELDEYFRRRLALVEKRIQAEIEALERLAVAEKDPDKREALLARIYEQEQEVARARIELEQERRREEEKIEEERARAAEILADIKLRAEHRYSAGLQAEHDRQLAEMDRRHQEEIERLEEAEATKAKIKEARRLQELEKERLLAQQRREIEERNLQMRAEIAGRTSQIFQDLYTATGEQVTAFLALSKAAAVAEAMINAHLAATRALAEGGPYAGPILAGVIYAQALAHVAAMTAQTVQGGVVEGFSPTDRADNVVARLTAGEFVQPRDVVRHYGTQAMEAIRQKLVPREILASVGASLPLPPARPATAGAGYADGGPVAAVGAPGRRETKERGRSEFTLINVTDPRELDR
jgi:hypothetical protein